MTDARIPSFDVTLTLIRQLFGNRVDLGGEPYWHHPLAVALKLPACATPEDRLIALLHDVLEDCRSAIARRLGLPKKDMNIERAVLYLDSLGYTRYVVDGVWLLTHEPEASYEDYVATLIDSRHIGALLTKRADLAHNMDSTRQSKIREADLNRIKKKTVDCYEPAISRIETALYELGVVTEAPVRCAC